MGKKNRSKKLHGLDSYITDERSRIDDLRNIHLKNQEPTGRNVKSTNEAMQLENLIRESGNEIGEYTSVFGINGFENDSLNFQLEFPKFDGNDARSWLRTCNRYFEINRNIPEANKVIFAIVNMEGKAELWGKEYLEHGGCFSWSEFVSALLSKFEDVDQDSVVREFHNLKQQGTVNELLNKFEELRSYLMLYFQELPSEYFTFSFVSMLRDDIKETLHIVKPRNFEETVSFARYQELVNDAMMKRNKMNYIPQIKFLTSDEMSARFKKNLCYNCYEVYSPGHRCKQRQSFVLMTKEEEEAYVKDTMKEQASVSVNAVPRNSSLYANTLKVNAYGKEVYLVVSLASTHCYLDEGLCEEMGCRVEYITPIALTLINGEKFMSTKICPDFKWDVQGYRFQSPMRIIDLGGCDGAIGGNWLHEHCPFGFKGDHSRPVGSAHNMILTLSLKGGETAELKMTSSSGISFFPIF